MFRLVFLTFHGERRVAAVAAPAHPEEEEPAAHETAHSPSPSAHSAGGHAHDPHTGHGHGGHGHLHDAPPAMAMVLVILALGSVLAGYVGVPAALGGNNWIEHYLHPSFVAHGVGGEHRQADRSSSHVAMAGAPAPGEHGAESAAASHGTEGEGEGSSDRVGLERTLMLISSIIAILGIGLAWYFFVEPPERCRHRCGERRAAPSSAAAQVLRGRGLRRGDRSADQARVDGTYCGRALTPASSMAW